MCFLFARQWRVAPSYPTVYCLPHSVLYVRCRNTFRTLVCGMLISCGAQKHVLTANRGNGVLLLVCGAEPMADQSGSPFTATSTRPWCMRCCWHSSLKLLVSVARLLTGKSACVYLLLMDPPGKWSQIDPMLRLKSGMCGNDQRSHAVRRCVPCKSS